MNLLKETIKRYTTTLVLNIRSIEHNYINNYAMYHNAYNDVFVNQILNLQGTLIMSCFCKYDIDDIISDFYEAIMNFDSSTFLSDDIKTWDSIKNKIKLSS